MYLFTVCFTLPGNAIFSTNFPFFFFFFTKNWQLLYPFHSWHSQHVIHHIKAWNLWLPPSSFGGGHVFIGVGLCVSLCVCQQNNSKSYWPILMKISGKVGHVIRKKWLVFGGDRYHRLDPGFFKILFLEVDPDPDQWLGVSMRSPSASCSKKTKIQFAITIWRVCKASSLI